MVFDDDNLNAIITLEILNVSAWPWVLEAYFGDKKKKEWEDPNDEFQNNFTGS